MPRFVGGEAGKNATPRMRWRNINGRTIYVRTERRSRCTIRRLEDNFARQSAALWITATPTHVVTLNYNEGKACDAIIRRIEAREGRSREDVRFPEKEGHINPIELACRIGDRLFAFEHTGIEPFAGHMQMEAQAAFLFGPIERLLAGKLPPDDTFELLIPVHALREIRGQDLVNTQAALTAWAIVTAPSLPRAPYAKYLPSIRETRPPGVPFS